MTDLVDALKAEVAALEKDLSADPRFRKLLRVRATLNEYIQNSMDAVVVPEGYKLVRLTKEEKLREAATAYLKAQAGLALKRAIALHMVSLGLIPEGEPGVRQLYVYMARWPEFVSRGKGWVELKPETANDGGPKETAASPS